MIGTEAPDPEDWLRRARWFSDRVSEARAASHGGEPGEHAAALLEEVESVFCAGAWIATVILSQAAIEAHVRATTGAGQMLDTRTVLSEAGLDERFDELRRLRNTLLHPSDPPVLTVDMLWFERVRFEEAARRAVSLLVEAMFVWSPR